MTVMDYLQFAVFGFLLRETPAFQIRRVSTYHPAHDVNFLRDLHPRCVSPSQLHSAAIDFQSDDSRFGRGEMHLSALLEEGDVVVYQTGSWLVDGVAVGEDVPPSFEYCSIETLQVVWTHNCEHGVLRGCRIHPETADDGGLLLRPDVNDQVEFGPEQLLARVPVQWIDDAVCQPVVKVSDEVWEQHALV